MDNQFIKKLQGFASLSDEEVRALERATAHPRSVGPRNDLIREGDKPGPVFILLEGWALRKRGLRAALR